MADKSIRNDIELLRKILKHQDGINETLIYFNLKTVNEIAVNNIALKALALDVGQIGELAGKLTKDTVNSFKCINVKLAYGIRNRIDHAYLSVKPQEIALTAMQLCSNVAIDEIKLRIKECVSSVKSQSN